jgi:hypothetical protein
MALAPIGGERLLTRADAIKLRARIQAAVQTAITGIAEVQELLAEAKTGQAHVALGYKDWSGWVADTLAGQLDIGEASRANVIRLLSGEGMSLRAIGKAVGSSHTQVRRELEQNVPVDKPDKVRGLDGKERRRPAPKPVAPEPLDVEVVEAKDDVQRALEEATVINGLNELLADLLPGEWLTTASPKAKKHLAKALQAKIDQLGVSPEPIIIDDDDSVSIFCDTSRDDMRSVRILKNVITNVVNDHLSVEGIDAMQELLNAASRKLKRLRPARTKATAR